MEKERKKTHPKFFFEFEFFLFALPGEFTVEVILFLAVFHLQSNLSVFILWPQNEKKNRQSKR